MVRSKRAKATEQAKPREAESAVAAGGNRATEQAKPREAESVVAGGKAVRSEFEAGLLSQVRRQGGLSELMEAQGVDGAYVDSCFSGSAICGSVRYERVAQFLTGAESGPSGCLVRFGGGVASATHQVTGRVRIGRVEGELTLLVVKGHLPLLLGEGAMAAFSLDLMGARREVVQQGVRLGSWEPGQLPTCVLETESCLVAGTVKSVSGLGVAGTEESVSGPVESSKVDREHDVFTIGEISDSGQEEMPEGSECGHEARPEECRKAGRETRRRRRKASKRGKAEAVVDPSCTDAQRNHALHLKGSQCHDADAERDEERDAERDEERDAPKEAERRQRSKAEKVLRLTQAQVSKIHRTNHAGFSRMVKFLRRVAGPMKPGQFKPVEEKIKKAIAECKVCENREPRAPRCTVVPCERSWLERGVADFFKVNAFQKTGERTLWGLIVMDSATKRTSLSMLRAATAKEAWKAYMVRWASVWGHFQQLLTDPDTSFLAQNFLKEAELAGVIKSVTPAKSSESHGEVERPIRVIRHTIDRLSEQNRLDRREWTEDEWEVAIAQIENAMNNEVVVGSTPSERTTGRGSHMALSALSDTLVTGHEATPGSLQRAARDAQEIFMQTNWSGKFRAILTEAPAKAGAQVKLGDLVRYCREEARAPGGGVRGRVWHGPGVVVGVPAGMVEYVRVDHGGVDYLCHRNDVKLHAEQGISTTTTGGDGEQGVATTSGDDGARATRQERDGKTAEEADKELRRRDAHGPRNRPPPGRPPKGKVWVDGRYADPPTAAAVDESSAEAATATPVSGNVGQPSPAGAVPTPTPEARSEGGNVGQPSSAGAAPTPTPESSGEQTTALATQFVYAESESEAASDESEMWRALDEIALVAQKEKFEPFPCFFNAIEKRGRLYEEVQEICELTVQPPQSTVVLCGDQLCLFSEGAMDAYAYQWTDLSEEARHAAYERALRDYDSTGSWERGTEKTAEELRSMHVRPMEAREVCKAKIQDGELMGRVRWTPKGFQERGDVWLHENTTSPTVHRITTNTLDALASAMPSGDGDDDWVPFVLDFSEAFFHSELFDDAPFLKQKEQLYVRVPDWDTGECAPEAQAAAAAGAKIYRRLLREVPGTKGAPQAWYRTVSAILCEHGVRSKLDPCAFFFFDYDDAKGSSRTQCSGAGYAGYGGLHVDDMRGRAKRRIVWALFNDLLNRGYKVKLQVIEEGDVFESIGERFVEKANGVQRDQHQYVDQRLTEVPLPGDRWKFKRATTTTEERAAYGSAQGQLSWVAQRTKPEAAYESSVAATLKTSPSLTVADVCRLNKTIRTLKNRDEQRWSWWTPKIRDGDERGWRVVIVADAGEGESKREEWNKSQGGRIIGLMAMAPVGTPGSMAVVDVSSRKVKRQTHSSFDAETVNGIDAVDVGLGVRELVREWTFGVTPSKGEVVKEWMGSHSFREDGSDGKVPMELHTDCEDLVTAVEGTKQHKQMKRRRRLDVADLRELRARGELRMLLHVDGRYMHADCLTKPRKVSQQTSNLLRELLSTGHYWPVPT